MTHTQELILNTGEFIEQSGNLHDVILNRLDVPHFNNGKPTFYDADEFRKMLSSFPGSPVVFARSHPNNIGKMSLEDALLEVDGRLVGTGNDAHVNDSGTLFRGNLNITDDDVNELIKKGEIYISTGLLGTRDEHNVLRGIVQNHILLYPVDTGIVPGDHAALFLNQSEKQTSDIMTETKTEPEILGAVVTKLLDVNKELVGNQTDGKLDDLKGKIDKQKIKAGETDELVKNMREEMKVKDTELSTQKNVVKEHEELITNQKAEIASLNELITNQATEIENYKIQLKEIKLVEVNKKKERIFNQHSAATVAQFMPRHDEIFNEDSFYDLIGEMNQADVGIPFVPTAVPAGSEHVNNQSDDMEFVNGIDFSYKDGKPVFKGVKK